MTYKFCLDPNNIYTAAETLKINTVNTMRHNIVLYIYKNKNIYHIYYSCLLLLYHYGI